MESATLRMRLMPSISGSKRTLMALLRIALGIHSETV
jgi:hypothetical protein